MLNDISSSITAQYRYLARQVNKTKQVFVCNSYKHHYYYENHTYSTIKTRIVYFACFYCTLCMIFTIIMMLIRIAHEDLFCFVDSNYTNLMLLRGDAFRQTPRSFEHVSCF